MRNLAEKIRGDFPALHALNRGKPLVYFDNACMTLKPKPVTDAILAYYHGHPGCHGRTSHLFGAETTRAYNAARRQFRKFFNAAAEEEIVFVRNATEAFNLLANTIDFQPGDEVVTSDIEHNSNLLPWQMAERKRGIRRVIVPTREDGSLNLAELKARVTERTKLVSIVHTSNVTGVTFPLAEIVSVAHGKGAAVCVDAAQAALHHVLDVRGLDVDYLVTSVHKMWGPTGMGVLYGKRALLEALPQFLVGGETVLDTTYDNAELAGLPDKFEAGLQNYAGAMGAGAAVAYVHKIGRKAIHACLRGLNGYATEKVAAISGVRVLGPSEPESRSGILNLLLEGVEAEDASRLLNESANVMTRFGKHCVHSWYHRRGLPDSLRASFSAYNTTQEIDIFANALKDIMRFFKKK